MASPSVLAAMTMQVLEAAASLGADVAAICGEAGLAEEWLADPDGRVPLEQHLKMWEILSRRGDGLQIGARIGIPALGVIGYAMQHEATVGEALAWQQRVGAVLYPGLVPQLERRRDAAGDYIVFVRAMVPAFARLREPVYAQAAAIVTMMRALAGAAGRLAFVALPASRPPDPRTIEDHFACPVAWDAPLMQLGFDAAVLAVPLPRSDPRLFGYLARRAEDMLARLPEGASWADRVRREIGVALAEGEPRLAAVAKRLAVSERTLHRRLLDETTNFAGLVDEARHAGAAIAGGPHAERLRGGVLARLCRAGGVLPRVQALDRGDAAELAEARRIGVDGERLNRGTANRITNDRSGRKRSLMGARLRAGGCAWKRRTSSRQVGVRLHGFERQIRSRNLSPSWTGR